jgi:hypothetical protein
MGVGQRSYAAIQAEQVLFWLMLAALIKLYAAPWMEE